MEDLFERLLQVSLVNTQGSQHEWQEWHNPTGNFKPIKLEKYNGVRDSMIINKWIWDTESYFMASRMKRGTWMAVVSHFLEGDAYNWFVMEERWALEGLTWNALIEGVFYPT